MYVESSSVLFHKVNDSFRQSCSSLCQDNKFIFQFMVRLASFDVTFSKHLNKLAINRGLFCLLRKSFSWTHLVFSDSVKCCYKNEVTERCVKWLIRQDLLLFEAGGVPLRRPGSEGVPSPELIAYRIENTASAFQVMFSALSVKPGVEPCMLNLLLHTFRKRVEKYIRHIDT